MNTRTIAGTIAASVILLVLPACDSPGKDAPGQQAVKEALVLSQALKKRIALENETASLKRRLDL